MEPTVERYQLPENTGTDVRKMYVWLCGFFGLLIGIGILIIMFAQTLVKFVPFSAEERFIRPYERFLVAEGSKKLSETDQVIQSYLEDLVEKLSASDRLSGEVTFKIHYNNNATENAFATLGGHMIVYRGLMEAIESENGLAMVIAHEMAHIENRDPAAGMGRAFAISMMIASISGGYSEDISASLSDVSLNRFSRKQEEGADILALDILYDHYGHVGGRDEFFQKLKDYEDEEIDIPAWLSSHPETETRITYLENESAGRGYPAGETIPLPTEIKEALAELPF